MILIPIISFFLLTRALDIHKVGVGTLYKSLELVGALLVLNRRVKKIDSQLL